MAKKASNFIKTRILHTILPEFYDFLRRFETSPCIARIIPARIKRQQKGSSDWRVTLQYNTPSGWKLLCKKWSTAQELFVICQQGTKNDFLDRCETCGVSTSHIERPLPPSDDEKKKDWQ